MYVRVWEYAVPPGAVDAFVAAYRADGTWAALFAQGRGYLGTELYRHTDDPHRFVTVDRWAARADWDAFLAAQAVEYAALDARLDRLGVVESPLVAGPSG